MTLTQNQIHFYHENGYLEIPNLFSKEEIEELHQEALKFEKMKDLDNVILEDNGDLRSVFSPNKLNEKFNDLYKYERLVNPVKQLLESDLYLFQYKLNNKKSFVGAWWEWHQDFPFWNREDGIPKPNLVSAMILMQDTGPLQGPLVFIPKSHKDGLVAFEPKPHHSIEPEGGDNLSSTLSADIKYTVNRKVIKENIEKHGFVQGTGKVGTCFLFHPYVFHGSNSNISPYERNTTIITYNDITNLPIEQEKKRPEYVSSRNFEKIEAIKHHKTQNEEHIFNS
jgi:ectoine hydroxylase